MDDEDLFAKAMSVVRPLSKPDKITFEKPKPKRRAAQKKELPAHTITSSRTVDELKSESDPWTLKASGVSQEKLKQLGAGRPSIDIETDLHGMTRDEACKALEKMFEIALTERARVLCIVHGRGLHSQGKPVLKEAVYQWLRSGSYAAHILAVIPKPYTGGGSCLVLLRRDRKTG